MKAYDRVHFDYLVAVIKTFNVPDSILHSIMTLFSNTRIQINFNWFLTDELQPERGYNSVILLVFYFLILALILFLGPSMIIPTLPTNYPAASTLIAISQLIQQHFIMQKITGPTLFITISKHIH